MPTRRPLHHVPPSFVPDGSWFFLTICCQTRGIDQLCRPEISRSLLDDAALYHRQRSWVLHLLLLMPDHLHAIVGCPVDAPLSATVRNWKRLTARRHKVRWQRNFFDHRLRADEGLEQKAHYIRENPVRAGLVQRAEDWAYYVDYRTLDP